MPSTVSADIPIIDLAGDQKDVSKQLVEAAAEHGFIYIRNLGLDIPGASVDDAFSLSKKLFDAPVEEKQSCSIQTNNRGWSGMHTETLDPKNQKVGDFKEAFNFGEFIKGKAQQPLPPTILKLLGQGLDVDDFFSSAHFTVEGGSSSVLRFLRYPPPDATTHSTDDVRAGAHSDYGSITLLFRLKGQAGLEILKKDNTWAPVPVCPPGTENDPSPPILINIGDLLSYWTNGLFRSTVHRVAFGAGGIQGESNAGPRYSIAFFCQPMDDATLDAVPSERVKSFVPAHISPDANPYAEKKVMTAGDHLHMRLKETYGTLYDDKKDSAVKA